MRPVHHGQRLSIIDASQSACGLCARILHSVLPTALSYNHCFIFHNREITLALDENIYELRREKLKRFEALGQRIYPTKYEITHTNPQILDEYREKNREQ